MVWAKAAEHHGASGIAFSSATRIEIGPTKVVWYISTEVEDNNVHCIANPLKTVLYVKVLMEKVNLPVLGPCYELLAHLLSSFYKSNLAMEIPPP